MATHDGLAVSDTIDATESADFEATLARPLIDAEAGEVISSPDLAIFSTRSPVSSGGSKSGILAHDFGIEQIYERVWVSPDEIDAGFIADSKEYQISVWNAFRSATKQITAITPTNPDGTTLTYGALPITLPPTGEELHTLTVLQAGPIKQETTYTYTVDSVAYAIDIIGDRIVPFVFEPNRYKNVKISYLFKTIVQANKVFKEQRRPMWPRLYREINFGITAWDIEAQEILNTMGYSHNKILAIPIYTEPLHATTILTGATEVTIDETLTDRWNLSNLTDFLFFLDFESGEYAVKQIDSIAAQKITLTRSIAETLDKDTTVIYPLMLCIFENFRIRSETIELLEADAAFKELVLV